MAEIRYPGARWNPGAAAGYALGQTDMRTVVCHYTVGYNSAPVGLQGYFHFLVSRDGTVQQFCEANALAWHAGEWNGTGPGIEIEFYDEDRIFTDAARDATGRLVQWIGREWGIPKSYYDGPRIFQPYAGFISHRSLIQTQEHNDYWPRADWDAMVAIPAPDTPQEDRMKPALFLDNSTGHVFVYDPNNHTKTWLRTPASLAAWQAVAFVNKLSGDILDNPTSRTLLADAVELKH